MAILELAKYDRFLLLQVTAFPSSKYLQLLTFLGIHPPNKDFQSHQSPLCFYSQSTQKLKGAAPLKKRGTSSRLRGYGVHVLNVRFYIVYFST